MRRFSDKHSMHTLNELNVTPLLDLAFVLLLIFMITTPLMENSTELILPSGQKDGTLVDPNSVLNVSIFRDNKLMLNTEVIEMDRLTERLAELHALKPEVAVVVRSHKELPVQQLMDVLDAVKRAQITKVGLAKIAEGQ